MARADTPEGQVEAAQPPASIGGAPARWHTDEQGRTFRVAFDPGSRWFVGWRYAPGFVPDELQLDATVLETGVVYRHVLDFPAEGVAWKLYHASLSSQVQLTPGVTRLQTTLYRGRAMRWSREGSIVLPTNPPRHVPFPFNIGVEASVGSVDYEDLPRGFRADIGVARAEVVLDVWRRRALRSYAQFGVGPAYEIWLDPPAAGGEGDEIVLGHVVAPFTRASAAFHHESGDGHHAVDLGASGGYALTSHWGGHGFVRAQASYEAIVVAVNDLPVSAVTSLHYRFGQASRPQVAHHQVGATLGLRLSAPF